MVEWPGAPARAIEGLMAGSTTTACGLAGTSEEDEEEEDDHDDEDNPTDPIVPRPGVVTVSIIIASVPFSEYGHFYG